MSAAKRRFGAALLGLTLVLGTATLAASAQAAPYVNAASVSVGSQVVCATERLNGAGFAPGAVALTLHSAPVSLGSVTADASGNFSTTMTLPSGVDGAHTVVASQGTLSASAAFTIDCSGSGVAGSGAGGTGAGTGGGLSNTGVAVIGIGSLGLLLLLGGAVLLLAGKRRRVSA